MTDTTWTIGGIVTDGLIGGTPVVAPGATETLNLQCHGLVTQAARDYRARYDDLIEYARASAGSPVRTFVADTGEPSYRERVPSSTSLSTFVVAIEPGADVNANAFWAVVTDASDNSVGVGLERRVTLTVFVLAPYGDYADVSAVQSAFEQEVS